MHELLDGACMDKSTKQGFLVIINRGKIVILFFLLPFYFFSGGQYFGWDPADWRTLQRVVG